MAVLIGSGSVVLGRGLAVVGTPNAPAAAVPDPMVGDVNFTVDDAGTGGDFIIDIPVPPADNGSAITGYKYKVTSGGSLIPFTTVPLVVSDATTDGVPTNIYVLAVNAVGDGPDGTPKSVTTSVSTTRTYAQVKALHANDSIFRGAQATPGKEVGVDSLPAGASLAGDVITISANGVELDGWYGPGYRITTSGSRTGLVINNSIFESVAGSTVWNAKFVLAVNNGAVFDYVGWTTFRGSGAYGGEAALIKEVFGGANGASTTSGKITMLERCAFLECSNDGIKCASNGTIRDCYFGPPKHFDTVPPFWDSGTTFNTGDPVRNSTYLYISKVDGNVNHTPPSGKNSDTYWQNLDPHSDAINPYCCIGSGKKIYGNYINRSNVYRLDEETPGAYGHGVNTSFFPVPNSNSLNVPMAAIDFYNNILGGATTQSYPIHLYTVSGLYEVMTVRDGWYQRNNLNQIYYPSSGHTITGNDEDYVETAPG